MDDSVTVIVALVLITISLYYLIKQLFSLSEEVKIIEDSKKSPNELYEEEVSSKRMF